MGLVQWRPRSNDPIKEFFDLSFCNTDRALLDLKGVWYPSIDVVEDKDNIAIKADLPGLKKEDITVTVDNNILTIRGERKSESEQQDKDYHRVERFYGVFERNLDLGTAVDQSKIKASYNNGVLEVSLPKTEKVKSKEVTIE